jgi:hypothetical protein
MPNNNIVTQDLYNLFVLFGWRLVTMDAASATIVAIGQAGINNTQR